MENLKFVKDRVDAEISKKKDPVYEKRQLARKRN